jgi:hypothetical protein
MIEWAVPKVKADTAKIEAYVTSHLPHLTEQLLKWYFLDMLPDTEAIAKIIAAHTAACTRCHLLVEKFLGTIVPEDSEKWPIYYLAHFAVDWSYRCWNENEGCGLRGDDEYVHVRCALEHLYSRYDFK